MKTLDAGAIAPDFRLDQLGGGSPSLDELLAAGPVLLAFYKVTCPTCQLTLPYLDRLEGGALRVFAVSQDDEERTREFVDAFEVKMPQLLDRAGHGYPASNDFGVVYVPSMFLVEPDKRISWAWVGFDKKQLESLAAIAGRTMFTAADSVPESKSG